MIAGVRDLRDCSRTCSANFIRFALSFTALWATHLCPTHSNPRIRARQSSWFTICLNDFRKNYYTLSRALAIQKWDAEWKRLARMARAAAKVEFRSEIGLRIGEAESDPNGQLLFKQITRTDWPRSWGASKCPPLTLSLDKLFELMCEMHLNAVPSRDDAEINLEPKLGVLIGIFLLHTADARFYVARTHNDLCIARDVLIGIEDISNRLNWNLSLHKINDWDEVETVRSQLMRYLPSVPELVGCNANMRKSERTNSVSTQFDSSPNNVPSVIHKLTKIQAWPFEGTNAALPIVAEYLSKELGRIGIVRKVNTIREWSRIYRWTHDDAQSKDSTNCVKQKYVFKTLRERGYMH